MGVYEKIFKSLSHKQTNSFPKQYYRKISRSVRITHAGSLRVGLGLGAGGCGGGEGAVVGGKGGKGVCIT